MGDKVDSPGSPGSPDPKRSNEEQGKGKSEQWISDLARRSSGLPEQPRPASPEQPKGDRTAWRFAGLGIQLAVTTVLFAFMGHALDKKMGWTPWGTATLAFLAVIGNLYLLIKESLKEDGPTRKK